jgi:predicted flap endonuclease-1-like 5' DNA nuclease
MVFKLIRSVFGIDRSDAGTDVPVEQDEQNTAAAGTDASGSVADTRVESADAAEPAGAAGAASTERAADEPDPDVETPEEAAAAGTDAAASTGSLTEEPPADTAAAEPAEAAGPTDEDDEGGIPVEEVSGIGPAYAQRLNDTGIESVGDLLAADPEDVAASTDLSPKRISRWQDAAGDG